MVDCGGYDIMFSWEWGYACVRVCCRGVKCVPCAKCMQLNRVVWPDECANNSKYYHEKFPAKLMNKSALYKQDYEHDNLFILPPPQNDSRFNFIYLFIVQN